MLNFTYYNPVKVLFGRGTLAELAYLVPADTKVMMTYPPFRSGAKELHPEIKMRSSSSPLFPIDSSPAYSRLILPFIDPPRSHIGSRPAAIAPFRDSLCPKRFLCQHEC